MDATANTLLWINNTEGLLDEVMNYSAKDLEIYFLDLWKVEHPFGTELFLTPDGHNLQEVDWNEVEEAVAFCGHCENPESDCVCDFCESCSEKIGNCDCERCDNCELLLETECKCERCPSCEYLKGECVCEDIDNDTNEEIIN